MMLFRPCPCIEERREKKRGNGLNALKTRYPNPQICRPTTVCPPRQLAVPYPNGLFIAERRAAKKRGPSQASTASKEESDTPSRAKKDRAISAAIFQNSFASPLFFSPEPSYRENQCHRSPVGGGEETFFFPRRLWLEEEETHTRTYTQLQR